MRQTTSPSSLKHSGRRSVLTKLDVFGGDQSSVLCRRFIFVLVFLSGTGTRMANNSQSLTPCQQACRSVKSMWRGGQRLNPTTSCLGHIDIDGTWSQLVLSSTGTVLYSPSNWPVQVWSISLHPYAQVHDYTFPAFVLDPSSIVSSPRASWQY
jgi:hypothetical protein